MGLDEFLEPVSPEWLKPLLRAYLPNETLACYVSREGNESTLMRPILGVFLTPQLLGTLLVAYEEPRLDDEGAPWRRHWAKLDQIRLSRIARIRERYEALTDASRHLKDQVPQDPIELRVYIELSQDLPPFEERTISLPRRPGAYGDAESEKDLSQALVQAFDENLHNSGVK